MTETPGTPGSAPQGFDRLGERYEVGGLLGRGGMADVRVGRDLRLGRTVAVKCLRSDLATDPTFLARFGREAQSAAALNHPSIVAVYDTGEAPGPDDSIVPYIVMEYVDGQTLRDILRDGRKILPSRSLEITHDVLNALDYSHRAGIVHRDIKPGNVMLTPEGQVKVMDFGIARAIADSSSAMTQTAAVVGTAQYLSPEQARGEQVDARSDIYSTGCLLYELLTGRPPFVGDSPVSVAYQHVREEAPPPSSLNPEVSPSIDAVVARALAKRTEDRYQSAAEMRTDIERLLAGQAVDAPVSPEMTAVVPPAVVPVAGEGAEVPPDGATPRKKRRAWAWILAIVAVLAIVGVAAWGIPKLMNPVEKKPTTVAVPTVKGQDQQAAEVAIRNAKLQVGDVTRQANANVDPGKVIRTDPAAGTKVRKASSVDLFVSSGPQKVEIPYLIGKQYKDAKATLEQRNLEVVKKTQASDSPKNQVLNTDPSPTEMVEPGSTVKVTVSRGQTTVPDVVGMKQAAAQKELDAEGLKYKIVKDPGASQPAGTVTDQAPSKNEQVNPGSTIVLTVSAKPKPTTPPTTTPPTTPPTTGTPPTAGDFPDFPG